MYVFTLLAILLASLIIAYKEDSKICETVWPICIVMIILMYVLAFFRCLWLVDYISIGISGILLVWILKNNLYKEIFNKLATPQNLAIIIAMIIIFVWQKDAKVDISGENLFYAADVKSLHALSGFARTYGTVIPKYGDYVPGMQLFQWFFLHMSKTQYKEGLGIVGYSLLNMILLLPLLRYIRFIKRVDHELLPEENEVDVRVTENKKYRFVYESYHVKSKFKVHITGDTEEPEEKYSVLEWPVLFVINLIVCMGFALIPSMASGLGIVTAMPDVTLGITLGMMVLLILETNRAAYSYYLGILLYGSLIILLRTWGILFLLSALVILVVKIRNDRDYIEDIKYIITVPAFWMIEIASWVVLCIIKHRNSELTGYLLRAFSGKTGMVTQFSHKLLELLRSLTIDTIVSDRTGLLRLSPFIVALAFVLILRLLCIKGVIEEKDRKILNRYAVVMFIIVYGLIFFEYIHIWENPELTLTEAIERYGLPYMIGFIVIILGLWIKLCDTEDMNVAIREGNVDRQINNDAAKAVYIVYGILVISILLTAEYSFLTKKKTQDTISLQYVYSSDIEHFVSEANDHVELRGRRVLYLLSDSIDDKTKAKLSYEAAPVAVVYAQITDDFSADALKDVILNSHAQFIYCDTAGENISGILSDMCEETWESGRIYQIRTDGTLGYIDI